jgi:dTDP-4-dehydrorhamnose 3,5-epimerase
LESIETSIPGVWELRPKVFRDSRGFFFESYHRTTFGSLGIHDQFVQDNHSLSSKSTVRGLHYQLKRAQAKLCRVVVGEAFDVVVDIRVGSPTFGKWTGVLLSAKDKNQLYVPAGFAHGFLALTEGAEFLYKCSDFYDADDEHGILWNDPALRITWNVKKPLVSPRDMAHPRLAEISKAQLPLYLAK